MVKVLIGKVASDPSQLMKVVVFVAQVIQGPQCRRIRMNGFDLASSLESLQRNVRQKLQ